MNQFSQQQISQSFLASSKKRDRPMPTTGRRRIPWFFQGYLRGFDKLKVGLDLQARLPKPFSR